jgi:hypothetical protein
MIIVKKMKYKRNAEPLTACIRNSGFSAKSKVSAFNKSQCQTESKVLFNPLLLIHAKRWRPCSRNLLQTNFILEEKFNKHEKSTDYYSSIYISYRL